MAFSPVATFGFVGTNYNNVFNKNDWTRVPVLFGQVVNASNAASSALPSYLNTASQTIREGINVASQSDKIFGGVTKGLKFISNNINPFIIASSATKVLLSDKEERTSTLIKETGLVGGMFLFEGQMKKHLDKVLDKLPISPKWKPIIKGVTFIAGSLLGSTLGSKAGKTVAKYWETPLGKNSKQTEENQKPAHLSVKA